MNKILQLMIMATFIMPFNVFSQDSIYHFQLDSKDYEVIKIQKTYAEACTYAVERGGYLVQIDDETEAAGVYDAIINGAQVAADYTVCPDGGGIAYVWIGATDGATEGEWLWDGDNDGSGTLFWIGEGSLGSNDGVVVDNAFVNWGGSNEGVYKEPDNYSNQDAAAIALDGWPSGTGNYGIAGEWNDISASNDIYFVIEYDENHGIMERTNLNTIEVYPNPAIDLIEVKSPEGITTCEIIDITGATLLTLSPNSNSKKFQINITDLINGVYIVKFISVNNKVDFKKLIIK